MFIVQEDYFLVDASLHDFHMQYSRLCLNLMTQFDEGKGYEGIRIKIFEFENARSDIKKCCSHRKTEDNMSDIPPRSIYLQKLLLLLT